VVSEVSRFEIEHELMYRILEKIAYCSPNSTLEGCSGLAKLCLLDVVTEKDEA